MGFFDQGSIREPAPLKERLLESFTFSCRRFTIWGVLTPSVLATLIMPNFHSALYGTLSAIPGGATVWMPIMGAIMAVLVSLPGAIMLLIQIGRDHPEDKADWLRPAGLIAAAVALLSAFVWPLAVVAVLVAVKVAQKGELLPIGAATQEATGEPRVQNRVAQAAPGEVWWADVPFEENPADSKVRPVMVVANDTARGVITMAKITSQDQSGRAWEYRQMPMVIANSDKPSWIRLVTVELPYSRMLNFEEAPSGLWPWWATSATKARERRQR